MAGYLHMTPGVLYLLGAPLQLSERFRTKHYTVHRRLGRVLATAAMISVVFALAFGLRFPWGGSLEAIATAAFGCWFLTCLVLAVRAIRRGEVSIHRRWMIRAFAVGLGVGTIRIWIGLLLELACSTSTTASPPRSGSDSASTYSLPSGGSARDQTRPAEPNLQGGKESLCRTERSPRLTGP
jgi:uncharacterized membrane protein